jgi:hypothetical protein
MLRASRNARGAMRETRMSAPSLPVEAIGNPAKALEKHTPMMQQHVCIAKTLLSL